MKNAMMKVAFAAAVAAVPVFGNTLMAKEVETNTNAKAVKTVCTAKRAVPRKMTRKKLRRRPMWKAHRLKKLMRGKKFVAGKRFAVGRKFAAGKRFAAGRKFAVGRKFAAGKRFAAGRKFAMRKAPVLRRCGR